MPGRIVIAARHNGGMDEIAVGGMSSPVGWISAGVTRDGLAALGWRSVQELAASAAERGMRARVADDPGHVPGKGEPGVAPVLEELRAYFAAGRRTFDVPVDWRLYSPGQRAVLETLYRTVPYGESITYGALAERAGTGVPARGIGAIMGSNPIPIVVPCHRVLASDGLGGYSGGPGEDGLTTKRWLLTLEGVLAPTLDWAL